MHGRVERVEALTPQLVRVHLGGPGLDSYVDTGDADSYVNCQFPPAGAPYDVPFDPAAVRALPREQQPAARRYTVRQWDPATRTLVLDFVVHGDVGVAGRWAQQARPGDLLQMGGPAGAWSPSAEVDWHLLVGDESALPAIAVAAERAHAPVVAVVEVEDGAGEVALAGQARAVWVHRAGRHDAGRLVAAVQAVTLPAGRGDAFVHGEAESVRLVRRHLLGTGAVAAADLSFSPYWRHGQTDEQWRSVKRAWQQEVAAEA